MSYVPHDVIQLLRHFSPAPWGDRRRIVHGFSVEGQYATPRR